MELKSIKALEEIVGRAEEIATRTKSLDSRDASIAVPGLPVPLTIETASDWLNTAEECCSRPKVAE